MNFLENNYSISFSNLNLSKAAQKFDVIFPHLLISKFHEVSQLKHISILPADGDN